jgi:cold shock protein
MTEKRQAGVVKRFDPDRGFGFIGRADAEDVYVSQREVERAGLGALKVGDQVSFVVARVPDGRIRAERLARESAVAAPARPDTPTAFHFDADYLREGYFERKDDKAYLRPAIVDSLAMDVAKALGSCEMKASQLRRFFNKARGIEARLDRTNDFEAVKADIYRFKSDVAYQVGRRLVPQEFQQFVDRNVELAVRDEQSFRQGFLQHFESVLAYFVYFFRD